MWGWGVEELPLQFRAGSGSRERAYDKLNAAQILKLECGAFASVAQKQIRLQSLWGGSKRPHQAVASH
jgi:hypothetical protein